MTPGKFQPRFIFVREEDYSEARRTVKEQSAVFALVEREKWEREWRETYQGSYWKWLTHRQAGKAKLALMRLVFLIA